MARQTNKICDVCRKPTPEIKAKMYYSPLFENGERKKSQAYHSQYSHHMDVGVCCYEKILKLFNWQGRQTKEEYAKSRRAG